MNSHSLALFFSFYAEEKASVSGVSAFGCHSQVICQIIMGGCTSVLKLKRQGADEDKKPTEDVMYASINHNISKKPHRARVDSDVECEYSIVKAPAPTYHQPEPECSAKGECDDDYVLMGWTTTKENTPLRRHLRDVNNGRKILWSSDSMESINGKMICQDRIKTEISFTFIFHFWENPNLIYCKSI